jgi:hypothetical protein
MEQISIVLFLFDFIRLPSHFTTGPFTSLLLPPSYGVGVDKWEMYQIQLVFYRSCLVYRPMLMKAGVRITFFQIIEEWYFREFCCGIVSIPALDKTVCFFCPVSIHAISVRHRGITAVGRYP